MRKKGKSFDDSAFLNNLSYRYFYNELYGIAISRFIYDNMPEEINVRFLEKMLIEQGKVLFFYDEDLGYTALPYTNDGRLDIYNDPINRRAYATSGYHKKLNKDNSVIIYNNESRTNELPILQYYALKLYRADRAMDTNINIQKTPIIVQCQENERLTVENALMKYEGNEWTIITTKNFNPENFKVLNTNVPFISDKLHDIKSKIWNDAMTHLGIANLAIQKKERLISDEISKSQGGTIASRQTALISRQEAIKKINSMFGLNITVKFNDNAAESEVIE